MSFERTMTEVDLDEAALEFGKRLREQGASLDRDFAIDGMRESFAAKLFSVFRRGR